MALNSRLLKMSHQLLTHLEESDMVKMVIILINGKYRKRQLMG